MKPEYWDKAKRALARNDPVMGAIMRSHPRIFMVRRGEPFLTLARAIVGQQISVKAAQSVWDRLVVCVGEMPLQIRHMNGHARALSRAAGENKVGNPRPSRHVVELLALDALG